MSSELETWRCGPVLDGCQARGLRVMPNRECAGRVYSHSWKAVSRSQERVAQELFNHNSNQIKGILFVNSRPFNLYLKPLII